MLTLRFCCAVSCVVYAAGAAHVFAQGYAGQGYDPQQQQYPQQQYPQQQYQQYPQQQAPGGDAQGQQQQLPPGYFPTPDAQGAYGYQQQYAPNGGYPQQQQQAPGYVAPEPAAPMVSSVASALQLSAGISLVQVNALSMTQDAAAPRPAVTATTPATAAMQPAAAAAPLVTYCCRLDKHPLFVEAGYGLNANMLLGAFVQLASGSEKISDNSPYSMSAFSFVFAPKFDYQLSPSSRWNPFIGAVLSVSMDSKKYWTLEDSRTLFGFAARAGLRYFALDQVSFDPTVLLGYAIGSGTQKDSAMLSEIKYSASAIQFAVTFGISLWVK
jgi:hypothetical protein